MKRLIEVLEKVKDMRIDPLLKEGKSAHPLEADEYWVVDHRFLVHYEESPKEGVARGTWPWITVLEGDAWADEHPELVRIYYDQTTGLWQILCRSKSGAPVWEVLKHLVALWGVK